MQSYFQQLSQNQQQDYFDSLESDEYYNQNNNNHKLKKSFNQDYDQVQQLTTKISLNQLTNSKNKLNQKQSKVFNPPYSNNLLNPTNNKKTNLIQQYQENKHNNWNNKINNNNGNIPSMISKQKTMPINSQNQQQKTHNRLDLPQQFHKAKRMLNKFIFDYFNQLKYQYLRLMKLYNEQTQKEKEKEKNYLSKNGLNNNNNNKKLQYNKFNLPIKIYLNTQKFSLILSAIRKYIGIDYFKSSQLISPSFLSNLPDMNKKIQNQIKYGSYCYMSQNEKIIYCNKKGEINEINLKQEKNALVNFNPNNKGSKFISGSNQLIGDNKKITINNQLNQKFKLPDIATPVPFQGCVYLLDAAIFDKNTRVFIPDKYCYKVKQSGTIIKIESSSAYPIKQYELNKKNKNLNQKEALKQILVFTHKPRIKCGITRDSQFIYLFGGLVGQNKILSKKCEKFNPKTNQFTQVPQLNKWHRCPSTCILNGKFWVFSQNWIQWADVEKAKEYNKPKYNIFKEQTIIMASQDNILLQQNENQPLILQQNIWTAIKPPFSMRIHSFQFVHPYSKNQIIIFGGVKQNRKLFQVQIYNTLINFSQNYGEILPQALSTDRVWGPHIIDTGFSVLSNIQAQVYPDVVSRKNTLNLTYLTFNGIYIQSMNLIK